MNDINAVLMAQEYIKAHHSEDAFSIESVCNAAGYSRRQLDRLFQKHLKTHVLVCTAYFQLRHMAC